MKNHQRKPSFRFILVGLVILVSMGVISCGRQEDVQPSPTPSVTPYLMPTAPGKPPYLLDVGPTKLTKAMYDDSLTTSWVMAQGIHVAVWVGRIGISDENCNWETLQHRAHLFLNEKEVSNEMLKGWQDGEAGCALFRLTWTPELEPGEYEAKFQFETDEGEVLEYRWQISIE